VVNQFVGFPTALIVRSQDKKAANRGFFIDSLPSHPEVLSIESLGTEHNLVTFVRTDKNP
jgi:hypothetical protein